ncbi:MAG: HTH-type transcriptional regulator CymR [Pseudomonadota bacterium]|jgi:Rrf2 family protein
MFSNLIHNAVHALLLVCKYQANGPVTTEFISKRLGLSISYLESLMSQLKKNGFVISYRGPGGGYCTQGKPSELKLLRLIQSFESQTPAKPRKVSPKGELQQDLVDHLMHHFIEAELAHMHFEALLALVPDASWGHVAPTQAHSPMLKKFKPLQIHKLPSGPNSVFSLAQSMAA